MKKFLEFLEFAVFSVTFGGRFEVIFLATITFPRFDLMLFQCGLFRSIDKWPVDKDDCSSEVTVNGGLTVQLIITI